MPKKGTSKTKNKIASKPARVSQVRNSAIPRPAAPPVKKAPEITFERIAKKAYEIHASGKGGTELENWLRAERELRAGR